MAWSSSSLYGERGDVSVYTLKWAVKCNVKDEKNSQQPFMSRCAQNRPDGFTVNNK